MDFGAHAGDTAGGKTLSGNAGQRRFQSMPVYGLERHMTSSTISARYVSCSRDGAIATAVDIVAVSRSGQSSDRVKFDQSMAFLNARRHPQLSHEIEWARSMWTTRLIMP